MPSKTDEAIAKAAEKAAKLTAVVPSVVSLLNDYGQLVRDNADDPDAINAIADSMDARADELAAAVAANTPVAP